MCVFNTPKVSPAPQIIATPGNTESSRQADLEARRRRRAGAAANILTSPVGLPSATAKLGAPV
ncbi:hypothetical protein KZZ08_00560 [Roseovarius mucosus]|uniref:hypothetical protein n=1 Tax=Roseovarius mucosus TaxID=215743 RepID=UPI001C5EE0A5|nr:hypothetical protein [Roseovarius mucosus]MBW4972087.1 hypothetical protein [Roseovarius mucosus]